MLIELERLTFYPGRNLCRRSHMRTRGCQAGANSSPERRASALQVKTLASLFGIRGIGNMASSVKIILDGFLTRAPSSMTCAESVCTPAHQDCQRPR